MLGSPPKCSLPLLGAAAGATCPKQDFYLRGIHPLPKSPLALAVSQGSWVPLPQLGPLSPGSQGQAITLIRSAPQGTKSQGHNLDVATFGSRVPKVTVSQKG